MRPTLVVAAVLFPVAVSGEPTRKAKVFVPDSKSWEMSGGFAATGDVAGGGIRGGAQPQTAEITEQIMEKCPEIIVTMRLPNADYVLLLEHQGGKGLLRKDNKFVVYNKDGDAIKSGSTKTLGGSVKDACTAILQDWKSHEPEAEQSPPKPEGPPRP